MFALSAILAGAIASLTVAVLTAPTKTELRCPDAIPATLIDRMDSGTAYPGERFRFKTTAAGEHGPYLIPNGSEGYGYVRYVHAAGSRHRSGLIVLEPRVLFFGNLRLPVMWDPMEAAQYASNTPLAEQAIGLIPMPGLLSTAINTIRPGENVVIGPGFAFHVILLDDLTKTEPCRRVPVDTPTPTSAPSPTPTGSAVPSPLRERVM